MSLFNISIDPDNFDSQDEGLAAEVSAHKEIIEICAKYGVLIYGSEDFKSSIFLIN